jgi:hypothetical protein
MISIWVVVYFLILGNVLCTRPQRTVAFEEMWVERVEPRTVLALQVDRQEA